MVRTDIIYRQLLESMISVHIGEEESAAEDKEGTSDLDNYIWRGARSEKGWHWEQRLRQWLIGFPGSRPRLTAWHRGWVWGHREGCCLGQTLLLWPLPHCTSHTCLSSLWCVPEPTELRNECWGQISCQKFIILIQWLLIFCPVLAPPEQKHHSLFSCYSPFFCLMCSQSGFSPLSRALSDVAWTPRAFRKA